MDNFSPFSLACQQATLEVWRLSQNTVVNARQLIDRNSFCWMVLQASDTVKYTVKLYVFFTAKARFKD